ncbi:MAG: hypothetical protein KDC98_13100 [Planctomycetes bacterium]|nr:hypothetical protein [Planctomycetota bacterium]
MRVTFDVGLDATALEPSWLQVSIEGEAVAGDVRIDPAAPTVLEFIPAAQLPVGATVDVLLAAGVRGNDRRRLGSEMRWWFSIAIPGAVTTKVESPLTIWSGPDLFYPEPLVHTDPDEIGLVFREGRLPEPHRAAFWSQRERGWSEASWLLAETQSTQSGMTTAADGVGGVLAIDPVRALAVHHGRDLVAMAATLPNVEALIRMGDGRTTAWSRPGLVAGQTPASHDWDPMTRTWVTNLATVFEPQPTTSSIVLGTVAFDSSHVQRITQQDVVGARAISITSVVRDRHGAAEEPVEVGRFPPDSTFLLSAADDGHAMLLVREPTASGTRVGVSEFVPGDGFGAVDEVWQREGTPQQSYIVGAAIAPGGAAVFAEWQWGSTLRMAVRDADRTWTVSEVAALELGLAPVAVTPSGDALVVVVRRDDLLLLGRGRGGEWNQPVGMRTLGLVPRAVQHFTRPRLAALADGRFLLTYAAYLQDGQFLLQSVEIGVR